MNCENSHCKLSAQPTVSQKSSNGLNAASRKCLRSLSLCLWLVCFVVFWVKVLKVFVSLHKLSSHTYSWNCTTTLADFEVFFYEHFRNKYDNFYARCNVFRAKRLIMLSFWKTKRLRLPSWNNVRLVCERLLARIRSEPEQPITW